MKRANLIISIINTLLVLFLATGAITLSFDALQALAVDFGIEEQKAWLYPAIIDGAIIVFSLSVLRANLSQDSAVYPWALVSAFTLLSVVLNIIHAPPNFLARLLGAIPPIALFLSFELLMSQIKSMSVRFYAAYRLEELETQMQSKTVDLETLTKEIGQLGEQKEKILEEIEALQVHEITESASDTGNIEQARQARASKKAKAMNALLAYLGTHPNASLSEMAESIGRSKSTAGGYVSELKASNKLKKNGQGWEVVVGIG